MLSWTVGDVTIKRIVELEHALPYVEGPFEEGGALIAEARPETLRTMPWLYPDFVTPDGALKNSIHALLVEAPGLKLIVDTCLGNDKPRQALQNLVLHTAFLEDLAAAGFERHSVDAVVCTHLHIDHVGWNTRREGDAWVPTFPRARYLFGRAEYEHWLVESEGFMADQPVMMADSVQPIFDAGLAELVDTDHRLSPEIRLTPTPGHTPGHVSVVIESRGETAVITGDLMHHPCQIAHPHWTAAVDFDKEAARATRRRFVEDYADRPVLVIGTHFPTPTAGWIRTGPDGRRFDT